MADLNDREAAEELIRSDSLDAMIVFDPSFDSTVEEMGTGRIDLYLKDTEENQIQNHRLMGILDEYADGLRVRRFQSLQLDVSVYNVIEIVTNNLATSRERIADVAGGGIFRIYR